MHRLFLDDQCRRMDGRVWLSPALVRHIRALRLSPDESFILVDPTRAQAWSAKVDPAEKGMAILIAEVALAGTGPVAIALLMGLAKPDAIEDAIAGATELGAVAVRLIRCRRSPPARLKDEKLVRFERIARSAAEVAGRKSYPEISGPFEMADLTDLPENCTRVVLWEESSRDARSLTAFLKETPPTRALQLFIGPEGGLDAEEIETLEGLGFACLSLGPRILRARTAPVVALSLVQGIWGDLR